MTKLKLLKAGVCLYYIYRTVLFDLYLKLDKRDFPLYSADPLITSYIFNEKFFYLKIS